MRGPAAALAFGLGIGLPCLLAVGAAAFGWEVRGEVYGALAGVGFSAGLIVAAVVDGLLYRAEQRSLVRQREALTDATMVANLEREARLRPVADIIDAIEADELTPAQRNRQFEIAHWHIFYRRLVAAGTAYGWDIRTLTGKNEPTRVMSQPAWNVGTDQLAAAKFIVKDNTGTRPTVGEAEWNAERMWEQVPCPAGEPPDIMPPPYTRQQAQHKTAAKHAVIVDTEYQRG